MAETILTTRRGILKWLPLAGAAVATGKFPAQAANPLTGTAEAVFEAISRTAPANHRCVAVILKPSGIEASCMGPSGALLHRNPNIGAWV